MPCLSAPEPQIESLEQKPWWSFPSYAELHIFFQARVHRLCSGCWHLHRCLHHRPFKTCLTNGMNGFLSRIAHRIPHRISPPRENTSPGFSWLSGTCGSQDHSPKQQSSHDAKKCEGHKVLPDRRCHRCQVGPSDPSVGPGRPVVAHTSSLGSSCRASILGNPSASDMSIQQISDVWKGFKMFLNMFQKNMKMFPLFQCSHFVGNFLVMFFVVSRFATSYNMLPCESHLGQCCLTPLHMI